MYQLHAFRKELPVDEFAISKGMVGLPRFVYIQGTEEVLRRYAKNLIEDNCHTAIEIHGPFGNVVYRWVDNAIQQQPPVGDNCQIYG